MSISILYIVATIWAIGVSLILIVLLRQVSLISVRLNLQMRLPDMSEYGTGLEIGTVVPISVSNAVPSNVTIIALEGSCNSCHELANKLPLQEHDIVGPLIVLLAGKGEPTEKLYQKIPAWVTVIQDPEATQLSKDLNLSRTRWAIRLSSGVVAGHADISNIENLNLLMASELPDIFKATNIRNG